MAENQKDLRKYPRIPITTRLRFRKMDLPAEREQVIEKAVTNVSGGGIFVPTSQGYEKGALLQMEFRIPSRPDAIVVMGRVAWSGDQGMGVEFLKIDPRVKEEIIKNAKRGAWMESSPELPQVKVTPAKDVPPVKPEAASEHASAPPPEKPSPSGDDPFKL